MRLIKHSIYEHIFNWNLQKVGVMKSLLNKDAHKKKKKEKKRRNWFKEEDKRIF